MLLRATLVASLASVPLPCLSGAAPVTAAEETAASEPAGVPPVTGVWRGALEAGRGVSLRLVLHIPPGPGGAEAAGTGSLDSLDQGVEGIPVTGIAFTPSNEGDCADSRRVHFEVPSLAARYEGRLTTGGGRLVGAWRQGGAALFLELEHLASPE
ncbi:MAG: hypothetical protein DWQ36_07545 [Acidobacteria bacterium]|nr:MAG: hypothetical protein DWQ30_11770 [Acidobacteriota bacterium]REK09171.1 MAG: hypothetical protein DWQ36_07545 [Acidobacteriota bacterium]